MIEKFQIRVNIELIKFVFRLRTDAGNLETHGLCYHYSMRFLGKKIGKKQIRTAVLIFATLALFLSGVIPFLAILIK